MRVITRLTLLAACAAAGTASASCRPVETSCLCVDGASGDTTALATLIETTRDFDAGTNTALLRIDSVMGDAGVAVGATVSTWQGTNDAPGSQWLVLFSGGQVFNRAALNSQGRVSCPDTTFTLSVEQANTVWTSPSCTSALSETGYTPPVQPPCNASICSCGAAPVGLGVGVLAVVAGLRRRRVRAA